MGRYDFDTKNHIISSALDRLGVKLFPGIKASLVPTEVTVHFLLIDLAFLTFFPFLQAGWMLNTDIIYKVIHQSM